VAKSTKCRWFVRPFLLAIGGMLPCVVVCCSVLQCVAVCCSVLQCVAVCYSVLQCVAVCCSVLQYAAVRVAGSCVLSCCRPGLYCGVLQCVAVRCSACCWFVRPFLLAIGTMLQCVTVCCSVLQCAAVCCSVLQCAAVRVAGSCVLSCWRSGVCISHVTRKNGLNHTYK